MLLNLYFLTTAILTVALYWVTSFLWRYWNMLLVCRKLPTVGKPHWFWGHLYKDWFSSSFQKTEVEREMIKKTRAKIFVLWLGPLKPMITITHPETAKVLLKSSEPKPTFKQSFSLYNAVKPWLGWGLVLSYGRKWERNRRLLTPAFHFDILKPYIKIYNEESDILLTNISNKLKSDKVVEVENFFGLVTLETMLRCAFSYNEDIQTSQSHPYAHAVHRLGILTTERVFNPFHHRDWIYNLTANGKEFRGHTDYVHEFATTLISARRKSLAKDPSQLNKHHLDFLDILVTAKDEDGTGLSDEDIRAEVDTFLFAGHDSTRSAISWGIYYLGKYPEEQEKVYHEIINITKGKQYITCENINQFRDLSLFIKEVMRHSSTVPCISRYLTKPFVFDGVEIPTGTAIDISIYHMHHHPDVWPDPDAFRPGRFDGEESSKRDPFAYVPFSAGPRNCIGQHFALNEQKVMLARLIMRYKVHLVPGFQYMQAPEIVTRSVNGINIRFEER